MTEEHTLDDLLERIRLLDRVDACIAGTQVVPVHMETMAWIKVELRRLWTIEQALEALGVKAAIAALDDPIHSGEQ